MHEELKTLHVLAVIFLGGTVVVDMLAGILMPKAANVSELKAYTRLSKINQYLGWTAAVLVPIFGYALAADGDLALDQTWLLAGQILFWIAIVVSLVVMTPGAIRIANRVAALPDGPIPEEVMAELTNPIFPALGSLLTVFFIVIVYLMVAQP